MNFDSIHVRHLIEAEKMSVSDKHQLKILKDTVKNPLKGMLGGPSAEEAEMILKTKFKFTDKQLNQLKQEHVRHLFESGTILRKLPKEYEWFYDATPGNYYLDILNLLPPQLNKFAKALNLKKSPKFGDIIKYITGTFVMLTGGRILASRPDGGSFLVGKFDDKTTVKEIVDMVLKAPNRMIVKDSIRYN